MKDSAYKQNLRPDFGSSLANAITDVLATGIAVHSERVSECEGELYEEELHSIHNAVQQRIQEFTAGRICARKALLKLNHSPCSIPVGPTREPRWPHSIAGSITHDGDKCVACVANREVTPSLGIDLTAVEPLDRDLIRLICTEEDIKNIEIFGESNFEVDPYKLIFTIKESVYKCLFPKVQRIFDFQDVSVSIDSLSRTASITLLNKQLFSTLDLELKTRFCIIDDSVFSIVWV